MLLDEPLPPGTGWFFTLGSVLLALLSVQLLTGAFLTLYYAPTPGSRVRQRPLHHLAPRRPDGARPPPLWRQLHRRRDGAAHAAGVAFGSYKPPRELTWLSGLVLLALVLAFALTGYLLPWDQRAYWATVVTINISRLTPLAGDDRRRRRSTAARRSAR